VCVFCCFCGPVDSIYFARREPAVFLALQKREGKKQHKQRNEKE
jgi:hypothetical protein